MTPRRRERAQTRLLAGRARRASLRKPRPWAVQSALDADADMLSHGVGGPAAPPRYHRESGNEKKCVAKLGRALNRVGLAARGSEPEPS